jgi:hypothetical protein
MGAAEFYQGVFNELSAETGVVTFQQLLMWDDVRTLLEESAVTMQQLRNIWEGLPMKRGVMKENSAETSSKIAPQGVDVDGFREFNAKLDGLFKSVGKPCMFTCYKR